VGLVFLLSGSIGSGSFAGNAVAVISGFFYASMTVSLKLHKNGSQVETILLGNIMAAVFGLPFLFIHPVAATALPPVVFLGVFQIAIPYILYAKASLSASALDLALFPVIEPLLNPFWVFLGTGESPAALTYAGGCILIGVIVFRSILLMKRNPPEPVPDLKK
jgi:drug/metabolite transporter (DMT)-like permease